jgi:hypothetical protein
MHSFILHSVDSKCLLGASQFSRCWGYSRKKTWLGTDGASLVNGRIHLKVYEVKTLLMPFWLRILLIFFLLRKEEIITFSEHKRELLLLVNKSIKTVVLKICLYLYILGICFPSIPKTDTPPEVRWCIVYMWLNNLFFWFI